MTARNRPAPTVILLAAALGALVPGPAGAGELRVRVRDAVEAPGGGRGELYVQLFGTPRAFAEGGPAVARLVLALAAAEATVTLAPLPAGRYAVRVFQDLNGNGALDKTLLGVPKEPFGFSNDALGAMGPPDFDAAAVTLPAEQALAVNIRLRH